MFVKISNIAHPNKQTMKYFIILLSIAVMLINIVTLINGIENNNIFQCCRSSFFIGLNFATILFAI